jgi:hypothetical protein
MFCDVMACSLAEILMLLVAWLVLTLKEAAFSFKTQ